MVSPPADRYFARPTAAVNIERADGGAGIHSELKPELKFYIPSFPFFTATDRRG